MDSSQVNRELRTVVRPALRARGFGAFSERTAWRYHAGRIDIINFQSFNDYLASTIGCTTYSFALNLSVYLLEIPEARPLKVKSGHPRPEEWLGHLRLHPHRTLEQRELPRLDIWYIDPEGGYVSPAVRDALGVILETGLPWFERWGDDDALLAALTSADAVLADGTELPGAGDSPARNLTTGYVARRCGRVALARAHLSRALEQFEAIDRKNQALTLRKPMPNLTPPQLRQDVKALAD